MTELTSAAIATARNDFKTKGYVCLTCEHHELEQALKEVRGLLQDAMVLEHATIPTYLTMLYTLSEDADWRVTEVIRSVAVEEMLHLVLAGNLLNAVGGQPVIDAPEFLPDFPSYLPHKVDGIKVSLYPFSKPGIRQGLLIEHPKNIRPEVVLGQTKSEMNIGEFYALIEAKLQAMVEKFGEQKVFCGDINRQIPANVFYYGGGGGIVVVDNMASAAAAISMITDQGEGACKTIWTGEQSEARGGFKEVAHYFRFNEIYQEQMYQEGDTVESGPTGRPMDVDWTQAVNTVVDAKVADYPPGEQRDAVIAFNCRYVDLLAQLQAAFDGQPELLEPAVVAMCSLRNDFRAITANPFPGKPGYHCAPTFEYMTRPVTPGHPAKEHHKMSNSNQQTLEKLDKAYASGDLSAALACMNERIIWDISGPGDVPYLGVFYGHSGFSKFWALLGETVIFGQAGIEKVFFDGQEAMAYGGEQGRAKNTQSPYHYDWAIHYEFDENHLITRMRQYFNPSRIQAALSGHDFPGNPQK